MNDVTPDQPPKSPEPPPEPSREPLRDPTPPSRPAPVEDDKSVGELVLDISEQATILVREEIELAKTEISEKANKLLAGSVAGLVAGIILIAALILIMHGIAILLGNEVFGGRVWLGYLIEALVFIVIAAVAGLYAYRSIKKNAPPTPDMAIEEAKEIRDRLTDTPNEPRDARSPAASPP